MALLDWKTVEGRTWSEAVLGDFSAGDGVRFVLEVYPTCYRRGPYRLHIEVARGENHHLWGCFDEQDQQIRHYHRPESLFEEAEAIAKVLLKDRSEQGPVPSRRVEGISDPVATAERLGHELHAERNRLSGFVLVVDLIRTTLAADPEEREQISISNIHDIVEALMEDHGSQAEQLDAISEAWSVFVRENLDNDLDRLVGFQELAEVIGPILDKDPSSDDLRDQLSDQDGGSP